MKTKLTTLILTLSLTLTTLAGCSSAVSEPGNGKWRNSEIEGAVTADETIRLEDDFAAAVNQPWLTATEIPSGQSRETTIVQVSDRVQKKMRAVLDDETITGHTADVLREFAALADDWETRNAGGAEPLRPYLTDISGIENLDEMTAYLVNPERNLFQNGLFVVQTVMRSDVTPDVQCAYLGVPEYLLGGRDAYFSASEDAVLAKDNLSELVSSILNDLSYDEKTIRETVTAALRFEKKLAESDKQMGKDDLTSGESSEYLFDFPALSERSGVYPLAEILTSQGYEKDAVFEGDTATLAALQSLYTEENLSDFKAWLSVHLIINAANYLDKKTILLTEAQAVSKLEPDDMADSPTDDDRLFSYLSERMSPALDYLYLQKYADEDVIADVRSLVEDDKAAFREMISDEEWLSDEAKEAALLKLDAIIPRVVRPDNEPDYSDFSLDGADFLTAAARCGQFLAAYQATQAGQAYDRNVWDIYSVSTTATNAYYVPTQNAIYICIGFLEDPLYRLDMRYEEKLGILGVVVGHELTHAFDDAGSKYDKDGLENEWLSLVDRAAFTERVEGVRNYLSSIRPIPDEGRYTGYLVADEMTADLGGLKLAMLLAKDHADFDYDAFFQHYTVMWRQLATLSFEKWQVKKDSHPLGYLRINVGLQQFDEFQETYGITRGDGMYLAPEQRILVW